MTTPKRDLRRASELSTAALNRRATVTIGDVTGQLEAITPVAGRLELELTVGGARAWFTLNADTIVAVHRQDPATP